MDIKLFHHTLFAMNTRMDILLWGESEKTSNRVYNSIIQSVNSLEQVLSKFHIEAETYMLNQKAALQAVSVSSTLFNTVSDCIKYFTLTDGYFDISYQMKNKAHHSIKEYIKLNKTNQTISFTHHQIAIDFGGIGKGIALKYVDKILEDNDVRNACISFGESSILTRGHHPHGDYWPFSFQEESGIQHSLKLNNDFLSISGLHNGNTHIYSKGILSNNVFSVCIRSDNPVEAEVLSTALIAAPPEKHNSIIKNIKVKEIITSKI